MVERRKHPGRTSPALAAATYAEFRTALAGSGCRLCPLAAGRTTIVVDRGSPAARILLVGEGPGAEEDRQGLAFVGRSGKLLDDMLAEAGLDPARDILIANIVKCRPPGNRPPTREEAAACRPYLLRQIELVAPRVVVLLGASALKGVLPDGKAGKLSSMAGRLLAHPAWTGVEILVTFHPAFILRNRSRRPEMVRHLTVAAGRLAELVREAIPYN